MNKPLAFAAAIMLASAPSFAAAQPINPNDGQATCLLSPNVFSNITPTSCVGFFSGNSNKGGTGTAITSGSDYFTALQAFGFNMNAPHNVVWKGESWGGGAVGATMYGLTVVGFHWGNYPNAYEGGSSIGNVSAFYMFDAGAGMNSIQLKSTQGISNAVILHTGTSEFDSMVTPEPSSIALFAVGLAGVGIVARKRRKS